MKTLTTSWTIAVRRIATYRGVSLAIAAGILAAAVVLAFIPIYERTMRDLGVQFTLEQNTGETPRAVAYAGGVGIGSTLSPREALSVDEVERQAGWFLDYEVTGVRSNILSITPRPAGEEPGRPVDAFLATTTDIRDRLTVLEGEWPEPGELAAVIGEDPAGQLGLAAGDEIGVVLTFTNCFPAPPSMGGFGGGPPPPPCDPVAFVDQTLVMRVAAIVEPVDPLDRIWTNVLFQPNRVDRSDQGAFFPVVVPPEAFRGPLAGIAPGMAATASFLFRADIEAITATTADDADARLAGLADTLRASDILITSRLDDALDQYNRQADFSTAPISLLAFQAALVVVVYVLVVGALLADQLLPETVLLRARGASIVHILSLTLFQGLTFALPGLVIAPFAAAGIVALLGFTPAFELGVVNGALPFALPPLSFAYAGGGALIATLAATIPTVLSARMRPQEERRRLSRADQAPFFQRYYLDVGALAVAGALIVQLGQAEAVFQRNAFGGLTSDPLVLLAPTIFGLAAIAILLRVIPVGLRLAATVLRPLVGATGDIALVSLSRASGRYARLVALLVLVFALGAFAATFAPTMERSFEDRTEYGVGPDLRADALGDLELRSTSEIEAAASDAAGISEAMAAWRGDGSIGQNTSASARFDILAVDPVAFPELVEWRSDFANGTDPRELFGLLANPVQPTMVELPGEPDALAIDVRGTDRTNTTMWVRLRDANGRFHTVDMGRLGDEPWTTYRTELSSVFTLGSDVAYPLSLSAIYFTEPTGFFNAANVPILLDDLTVFEGDEATTVDLFESADARWGTFVVAPGVDDEAQIVEAEEEPGRGRVLSLATQDGRAPRKRGIYPASSLYPVSAVASESFLGTHGLSVGSRFMITLGEQVVPAVVQGVTELAPTMDPGGRGFIIVDRHALFAWGQQIGEGPTAPAELWASIEPGADPEAAAAGLGESLGVEQIVIRENRVAAIANDPTLAAGAAGLLWFGFVAAFVVLCLAVILSLALDAVQRRVQFAVVRAMGFTARAIYAVLAIEYAVIVVIGAVAGTILGLQVSRQMAAFLEFTETGQPVRPPFVLVTDWEAVLITSAAFALFVVAGVVVAGVYLARTSIARSIRLDA